MPSRKSSGKPAGKRPVPPRPIPHQPQLAEEIIDPRWLVKALALTILAAIFCAWLLLCLLYYQGSWQLVLHPAKSITTTPASAGIPFDEIRFDAAETGQPRLAGWWIPASTPPSGSPHSELQPLARYAADTVLYLHDGSGSLSDTLPTLKLLHSAGINIFAIDYRGFGQSSPSDRPNSSAMAEDANAALDYLTGTRHIAASHIVPYGSGLGASLAAGLASTHPELAAVILDNPDPDPTATAVASHRSNIVPIRMLYHEHFDISGPLQALATPKLLITGGPNARPSPAQLDQLTSIFRTAHSPSIALVLPAGDNGTPYLNGLTRFLDQYLPATGLPR